jgi:hypothetical protein
MRRAVAVQIYMERAVKGKSISSAFWPMTLLQWQEIMAKSQLPYYIPEK